MKKITIMLIAFALIGLNGMGQTPNWEWAKSAGGTGADYINSISSDTSGYVYIAGYFSSPTMLIGTTVLTNIDNTGSSNDLFFARYNSDGNPIWAISVGGTGHDYATSIFVDSSGYIYLTGYFTSPTITFGTTTLTNFMTDGTSDIFVAKYDTAGNFIWAKSAGGDRDDNATSVCTDAMGNVFVIGYYVSHTIAFGLDTFTSYTTRRIFLVKYNNLGNVIWASTPTYFADGNSYSHSVRTDVSGNIYVTGAIADAQTYFGSFTLYSPNGMGQMFLVKYNSIGTVMFAVQTGGDGITGRSITIDALGDVYVTGYFGSANIWFGSYHLVNTQNGLLDVFIAKYSSLGVFLWARTGGGISSDFGLSITTDTANNVYAAGYYRSPSMTFDSTTVFNAMGGVYDLFLTKYSSTGNFLWIKSVGGSLSEYATSISSDHSGNIYVGGYYSSSTLLFDANSITNVGSNDMFLAKIGNTFTTSILELSKNNSISVSPNPATNLLTISFPANNIKSCTINLYDMMGEKMLDEIITHTSLYTINISTLPQGIYFMEVNMDNEKVVRKVVKM